MVKYKFGESEDISNAHGISLTDFGDNTMVRDNEFARSVIL